MTYNQADGFSSDELLAIGTRKNKLDLNISATDINSAIPYEMAKAAQSSLDGFSEAQLKDVAARTYSGVALPSSDTLNLPLDPRQAGAHENALSKLQQMLGIRTA